MEDENDSRHERKYKQLKKMEETLKTIFIRLDESDQNLEKYKEFNRKLHHS